LSELVMLSMAAELLHSAINRPKVKTPEFEPLMMLLS
jgi:hypothetical protein